MNAIGIPTARSAPRSSTTTSWSSRSTASRRRTPSPRRSWTSCRTRSPSSTTTGLEMPLFFSDDARSAAAERKAAETSEPVDPFSLGRRLTKPRITAVQGITYTIGIEIALGGDIVVAASDLRMCQLEPKRGLAPLGGATVRYVQRAGWGNAMYHLLLADEF